MLFFSSRSRPFDASELSALALKKIGNREILLLCHLPLLMIKYPFLVTKNTLLQSLNCQLLISELYRFDKQYSPISATPHLTICLIPSA